MARFPTVVVLAGWLAALVVGCDTGLPAGRTPHREFNFLDMVDQPRQKPQRPDLFGTWPTGLLEPPMGAVAIDEHLYLHTQAQAEQAAAELRNPLPASPAVIAHGKFVFDNVCITCHGPEGAGDGTLTLIFPKPPSLMTRKVRDWPDGAIVHRPMRGQGSMPSYARQVTQEDLWAVVHYLRDLQSRLPVAPPPVAASTATMVSQKGGQP